MEHPFGLGGFFYCLSYLFAHRRTQHEFLGLWRIHCHRSQIRSRTPARRTFPPRADPAAPEARAAGHLLANPPARPFPPGPTRRRRKYMLRGIFFAIPPARPLSRVLHEHQQQGHFGNHSSLPHPFTVEMTTGRTSSRLPSSPSSRLGVHRHMLQLRHKTTVPPAPA